jgi:CRISPR-associated protein Csd2
MQLYECKMQLGNAQANKLFETISVKRKDDSKLARSFEDYEVTTTAASGGVTGTELA